MFSKYWMEVEIYKVQLTCLLDTELSGSERLEVNIKSNLARGNFDV